MANRTHRDYPRAEVSLMVARAESPLGPLWPTRDIGSGGIYVVTTEPWDEQVTHALVIRDGSTALRVDAQVVRQDDAGVALRFVDLDHRQKRQADELLGSLFVHGAEVDEKRRAPRLDVATTARWELDGEIHAAFLEDLSATGANITSGTRPPVGAAVYVYVGISETSPRDIDHLWVRGTEATVTRHTTEGFAVSFDDSSNDFKESIRSIRLTARKAPQPT